MRRTPRIAGLGARVIGQHAGTGERQQFVADTFIVRVVCEQPLTFALDQTGVQFAAYKARIGKQPGEKIDIVGETDDVREMIVAALTSPGFLRRK